MDDASNNTVCIGWGNIRGGSTRSRHAGTVQWDGDKLFGSYDKCPVN